MTQKGGTGKSTLAASVAVAAEEAGERVFLIDLDPQSSLRNWSKRRQADTPPVDTVEPNKLADALTGLNDAKYTLAIIDTAGQDTAATAAAIDRLVAPLDDAWVHDSGPGTRACPTRRPTPGRPATA